MNYMENFTPEQQRDYEEKTFLKAIEQSHKMVKVWNRDVGVFRNSEGTHLIRELIYCRSEKGDYNVRYVALVRFTKRRKKNENPEILHNL